MSMICWVSWLVTLGLTCYAAYTTFNGVLYATSFPELAAVSAAGMATVVIPYVFTRALEGLWQTRPVHVISDRPAAPDVPGGASA